MAPLSDPVTDKARKTGKAETWGRFYETVSPEKKSKWTNLSLYLFFGFRGIFVLQKYEVFFQNYEIHICLLLSEENLSKMQG
jgi:hypothetical protein